MHHSREDVSNIECNEVLDEIAIGSHINASVIAASVGCEGSAEDKIRIAG